MHYHLYDLVRFFLKVEVRGSCWEWVGSKRDGYGHFGLAGKMVQSHRYSYELFREDIPKGLQIDHLCRNRACVNPLHMEVVSMLENIRRGDHKTNHYETKKTHCPKGHQYNTDTIREQHYIKYGKRLCKICSNQNTLINYRIKKIIKEDFMVI